MSERNDDRDIIEAAFDDADRASAGADPEPRVSIRDALDYFLPLITRDFAGQEAQDRIDARIRAARALHSEARAQGGPSPEPRWEEWARCLAPLVHDGLIDTPQERQIPDKAFYLARLLDEHLPAQGGPSLDVERISEHFPWDRTGVLYCDCGEWKMANGTALHWAAHVAARLGVAPEPPE